MDRRGWRGRRPVVAISMSLLHVVLLTSAMRIATVSAQDQGPDFASVGSCQLGSFLTASDNSREPSCGDKEGCPGYEVCNMGEFCVAGLRSKCPAGTFGSSCGLTSRSCSGAVAAGYFGGLGETSSKPAGKQCGSAAVFCPEGSSAPRAVHTGYYSTPESADPETRSGQALCPIGHYCTDGLKLVCPAGTFGGTTGLTTASCSGPCRAGFYCPQGSTSATLHPCGGSSFYCPEGSARPKSVTTGYYAIGIPRASALYGEVDAGVLGVAASSMMVAQEPCPPGFYCPFDVVSEQVVPRGVKIPCPPGRFGSQAMNTDPVCEGECAEGHLCPEGSVTSTPLTCGNVTVYCPKGSSVPTLVKSGYYTIGFGASQNSDVSAQNTQTGEEQCEPGTYCVGGVRFLCPPGKYGASAGATTSECSGKTHAGFFSPLEAETNPRPNRCAAGKSDPLSWYCPSGSTRPHPVSVGYFSIGPGLKDIYASEPGTEVVGPPANDTQVGQKPCTPGTWCANATRRICPRGYFGNRTLETSPTCAGLCQAGYICPAGSTSPRQEECKSPAFYCPPGSWERVKVQKGYYSVSVLAVASDVGLGGVASSRSLLSDIDNTMRVRTAERECEPGYFCVDARKFPCPPGRFGSSSGSSDERCDGSCLAGYRCPSASTNATALTCGGTDVWCPEGSSSSRPVLSGYYTMVENNVGMQNRSTVGSCHAAEPMCTVYAHGDEVSLEMHGVTVTKTAVMHFRNETWIGREQTRTMQLPCEAGYWCSGGRRYECAPGRYGARARETSAECTGGCKAGFACPSTSTSPKEIACPAPLKYAPPESGGCTDVNSGYYTSFGRDIQHLPFYEEDEIANGKDRGFNYELSSSPQSVWAWDDAIVSQIKIGNTTKPLYANLSLEAVGITFDYSTASVQRGAIAKLELGKQYECPMGYYCVAGRRHVCSAGRYGASTKMIDPKCSGACEAGWYCPAGSTTPRARKCGRPDLFCPKQSSLPTPVKKGYYTIGGTDLIAAGDVIIGGDDDDERIAHRSNERVRFASNETRTWQVPCEPGYWCKGGIKYKCPAGRYGNESAMSSKTCSGSCSEGHFCFPGSTVPTQNQCGGTLGKVIPMFGIEDMEMGQETFSGRDITMAHHHDRSTHIAEKLEWNAEHHVLVSLLGNDGVHLGRATDIGINDYIKRVSNEPSAVYCPEGSALPKPVRSGFYSVGGDNSTNTTRNGQVICPKGSFCVGGRRLPCPPGRYGDRTGLTHSACSGFSPAGTYAPLASANPLPCPDNTYATRGLPFCMPCPDANGGGTRCKTSRECCGK